jgi:hypothetical protein
MTRASWASDEAMLEMVRGGLCMRDSKLYDDDLFVIVLVVNVVSLIVQFS